MVLWVQVVAPAWSRLFYEPRGVSFELRLPLGYLSWRGLFFPEFRLEGQDSDRLFKHQAFTCLLACKSQNCPTALVRDHLKVQLEILWFIRLFAGACLILTTKCLSEADW